jgi:Flp pilus assembly protein TadG
MNNSDSISQTRSARSGRFGRAFARASCERGVAVVEFAVLLPVLLLIVLAIGDFGLAMNTYNNETQLANEGARLAVVNRNPGPGTLQSYIKSQGDTNDIRSNATVGICFPDGVSTVGHPVKVTVSITHTFLPFLKNMLPAHFASKTITGSATMRIEQNQTNDVYTANGCAS